MSQSCNELESEVLRLLQEQTDLRKEMNRISGIADRLGNQNQELRRKIDEKNNMLNETNSILEKALLKLKTLTRPPFLFAYFLEITGEHQADVIHDGKRKRVGVNPEVEEKFLMLGVPVIILESTNAIFAVKETPQHSGDVMILKNYIGNHLAVVGNEHGAKMVVYISAWFDINTPVGSDVLVEDGFLWGIVKDDQNSTTSNKYILAEAPNVDFSDIGGLDEEVALIRKEIEDNFNVPELYQLYGIPKENQFLFHGLPGNGKTTLAKAIAKVYFDRFKDDILKFAPGNFFVIRGPELATKWFGETEEKLREIFDSASDLVKKASVPVFIFIDDCEAFLLRRGAGISSDANLSHVTQFTTLLEGARTLVGVNVILATNRIDLIDPAVIERMNIVLRIPEPNKDSAGKVFRTMLRKVPLYKKYFNTTDFPKLKGERDKILSYITEIVVDKIYEDSDENNFIEIIFEDDTSQIIKTYDLLSNRIIRDIVNKAKKLAKDRDKALSKEEWPTGITVEDLLEAVQIKFKSNEGLPSTREMIAEWLKQKGITKGVVGTRKMFGEEIGEKKTRIYAQ